MVGNRSCSLHHVIHSTGANVNVPGQNVALKSGTAQIAGMKNGGYLTGETNYIFSLCRCILQKILTLSSMCNGATARALFGCSAWGVCQPNFWASFCHERSPQSSVNCQELGSVSKTTSHAMPATQGLTPRWPAEELCRNLVQPIVIGTGTKIKELSVSEGDNWKPISKSWSCQIRSEGKCLIWLDRWKCKHFTNWLEYKWVGR